MVDNIDPLGSYAGTLSSEEFDRSLLRAIHEASPEGILVVDGDGAVVSYNQRFLEIWRIPDKRVQPRGAEHGAIPHNPILLTIAQRVVDPEEFLSRVQELYANRHSRDHCEIGLKDGRTVERHSAGLRNDDGDYLGRVWFFRDITERKRDEALWRHLAWHDSLTGLMNRAHFFERANEELLRVRRHRRPLALLMLDLDHFKAINDEFGHAAGDAVLVSMCRCWDDRLRNIDLLARIGGEEFAVLLPDSPIEGAKIVAERLRLATHSEVVPVEGSKLRCTVSGGITMVRADDGSLEEALRRADDALYRAKELGRNRIESEFCQ